MERCITEQPEHFGPLFGYCDHQVQKLMDRRLRQYDNGEKVWDTAVVVIQVVRGVK